MTDAFLSALGFERITAQTFAERPGADAYPRIMHGPHRAIERRLRELNKAGSSVNLMVNKGDLQGRRTENVVAVTAYFADLDGAALHDEYPLEPTAIVESSPGKYHLYWRTLDAPLETFRHVQLHIADLLGSDPQVAELPDTLRLPGYLHQKAEPFLSRVLSLNPNAVYADEVFREAFAVPEWIPPRVIPPLPAAALAYLGRGTGAFKADSRHKLLDRVASAASGERNETLHKMACAVANDIAAGTLDADLLTENAGLRADKRSLNGEITNLQNGLPKDGSVILSGADKARWEKFQELGDGEARGKPEAISELLTKGATAQKAAHRANNRDAFRDAGYDPDDFFLERFDGVNVTTKTSDDESKKKVTTVKVGDAEKPLLEWGKENGLESTLARYRADPKAGFQVLPQYRGDAGPVSVASKTVDDLNAARPNPLLKGTENGTKNQVLS